MPKIKSQNNTTEKVMIIVALLALALFLMTLRSTVPMPASTTSTEPAIKGTQGLNDATVELNSQNPDQIDTGLNQLNTQTQGF